MFCNFAGNFYELVPFRAFPFRALLKIFPIRASSQVFTCGECRFVRWSADNAGYGHVRNTHPIFLIKNIILGVFFKFQLVVGLEQSIVNAPLYMTPLVSNVRFKQLIRDS
jgi:hypothetical protein